MYSRAAVSRANGLDWTVQVQNPREVCGSPQQGFYLTTSIELAPDLKKSVESSITRTLLRIPAQMTYTQSESSLRAVSRRRLWPRLASSWPSCFPLHLVDKQRGDIAHRPFKSEAADR